MLRTNRNLCYSAVIAAVLSLASCSNPGSSGNAQSSGATAAQHRFNVYFDFAKSGLTPEAQQVIAQAITEANRDTDAKVVVLAAKTDTSDISPSQRRADAVHAALVAGGIAPDRIDKRWVGYHEPPPRGLREPRNRMVEIAFE